MLFLVGAAASLAAPAADLPTTLLPSPAADAAANASTWTSISGDATMTQWCNANCAAGFCPPNKCVEGGDGAAELPSPSPKPAAPAVAPPAEGAIRDAGWGEGAFSQAEAERQNMSTALTRSPDTAVSDTAPAQSQNVATSLSAEEVAPKKKGKRGGGRGVRAERRHERRAAKKASWEARVAAAEIEAEKYIELEEKTESTDFEEAMEKAKAAEKGAVRFPPETADSAHLMETAKVAEKGAVRFPPETADSAQERDASEEEAAVRLAAKRRAEMKADQAKMEQAALEKTRAHKKGPKWDAFEARLKYDDAQEEEAAVRLAAKRRAEMKADERQLEKQGAYRTTPRVSLRKTAPASEADKRKAAAEADAEQKLEFTQFMASQKVRLTLTPNP